MTAPFYIPVHVEGDAEPVIIGVRDPLTAALFQALPTGYDLPVLDSLRGLWLCLHKAASPGHPWRTNRAHALADLDDAPAPFEPWREPVVLTDDDVRNLVAGGACEHPTRDAPPSVRGEAERTARRRAARRSEW